RSWPRDTLSRALPQVGSRPLLRGPYGRLHRPLQNHRTIRSCISASQPESLARSESPKWLRLAAWSRSATTQPPDCATGIFFPEYHWVRFVAWPPVSVMQGNDALAIGINYPEYHWVRFVDSRGFLLADMDDRMIGKYCPEYHWVRFVLASIPMWQSWTGGIID